MSGKSLAMMPWFPRDFIAATRHLALAERGAYRELLDYQWEMGALPKDAARLARLLGVTAEEFNAIWPAISDKFEDIDGGIANKRLEEHRKKAVEQRDRKINGANKTNAKRSAERQESESLSDTHSVPLTGTPPSPSPSPSPSLNLCRVEARAREMTPEGEMACALIKLNVKVTSMHPTLVAWVNDGFTVEQLTECVNLARQTKGETEAIPANYLDKILREPQRGPPVRQRAKGAFDRLMEANSD